MKIYIVYSYSWDPGHAYKAFKTWKEAHEYRLTISTVDPLDDSEFILNTDSFWHVGIDETELVE
jgi:hypothetical protein